MITNLYTRTTPINVVVADTAKEIVGLLLQRQSAIASMDYNRGRTAPHLADILSGDISTIDLTDDNVQIRIDYPSTIRFLDLKKTAKGKKKRYYTQIYNRPLYGHIYGRGYSLSNAVNIALNQAYRNYCFNLKNVLNTIDL